MIDFSKFTFNEKINDMYGYVDHYSQKAARISFYNDGKIIPEFPYPETVYDMLESNMFKDCIILFQYEE